MVSIKRSLCTEGTKETFTYLVVCTKGTEKTMSGREDDTEGTEKAVRDHEVGIEGKEEETIRSALNVIKLKFLQLFFMISVIVIKY